ncbi:MAG: YicC/YloC family endoribonuclease [Bacteroidota bacterium]
MLKSMTGYGRAEFEDEELYVSATVKTLNAKHADVNLHLPSAFTAQEIAWRQLAITHLERGKIVLTINYESKRAATPSMQINRALFKAHYTMLQSLAEEVGAPATALFQLALQTPEVITKADNNITFAGYTQVIERVIQEALQQCDQTRRKEGAMLAQNIATYLQHIKQGLASVEKLDANRIEAIREKLAAKLALLKGTYPVDENRLEQELIYYTERLDITEEKVRLSCHLAYFEAVMSSDQAVGKKLSFIAQEIGREINTIGSKSNDADIQKHVVLMKDELEKIKEQLQNIL